MLHQKQAGKQDFEQSAAYVLQQYLQRELEQLNEYADSGRLARPVLPDSTPLLDELFRKYLRMAWQDG